MSNGRTWGEADKSTLRRLVASGMTDAQIGEAMGRDRDFIGRKRTTLGLRPGVSPPLVAMMARINARRILLTFQSRSYA